MGMISELSSFDPHPNAKCTFCDQLKPSSFWMGQTMIFVCTSCAISKLPKLIADSIVYEFHRKGDKVPLKVLDDVKSVMFRQFMLGSGMALGRREKLKGDAKRVVRELLKDLKQRRKDP